VPGEYPLGGGRSLTKTAPAALTASDVGPVDAVLACVDEVAAAFPAIDVAVLFAGAARTALFDGAPLTLTAEDVAAAVRRLDADRVVVVHVDSWAHFSASRDDVRAALTAAGLAGRLVECPPGVRTAIS
jgi:NAD(P)-dependent dehydrogenase (short-subunit alcohol dehydrogenase family)